MNNYIYVYYNELLVSRAHGYYIYISSITFRWSRLTAIHVIADPRKRSYISQATTVTFSYISEIIQFTLPFSYYFPRVSFAYGSKYTYY